MKFFIHIVFIVFLCCSKTAFASEPLTNVDSFRHQFLDNLEYCEHADVKDTLRYLKSGYYSFVNFDNTSTFYKILFCYENKFMNYIDPDHYKYPVEEFYRVRDIRWVYLFYIERYIFEKKPILINKYCKINIVNIKTHEELAMYGGQSTENLLMLFQKLIRSTTKKSFKRLVIDQKIMTPLEYIGYKFEVVKMKSVV